MEITPWHEPVRVDCVLDDVLDLFTHYTHVKLLPNETVNSVASWHVTGALWTCATWFACECKAFPYLIITAPERNCGKSTVQQLMYHLVSRPLKASNATPAAIYYACADMPTLLIDEVDTFLKQDPQLLGILNSGYTSDGSVIRVDGEGKNRELRAFPTYCPKSLAGIGAGSISDALSSRGLNMVMERKPQNVTKRDLDNLDENPIHASELLEANRKLARLYKDYIEEFVNANPPMPEWLVNRNRQLWKPLLKLAFLGGQNWYDAALVSAKNHCDQQNKATSINENLLSDIREAFNNSNFISSADLILELCADEFKPWITWNHGKPITARQIATRLHAHGIAPQHNHQRTARGYLRNDFLGAWGSYCE